MAPDSPRITSGAPPPAAALGLAVLARENQRLEAQLRSSQRELRVSRLRLLSAADHERRRIERDLHDGAQQRLMALGIQLQLVADVVEIDPSTAAGRLRELAHQVDDAVDEVRSLARGLIPPMLVERGVVDALREAAVSSPLPAAVEAPELGRYAAEIESAVYFCCLEALQNAAKHAVGAHAVTVKLWEDGHLRFEVRDDGAGLPDGPHSGAGLTNMRDRIGAVGGGLTIESARGDGTCVTGAVPLAPLAVPHEAEMLVQRATDTLEDCFVIYRAVSDERGGVVDFLIEHVNKAACAEWGAERGQLTGRTRGQLDPGFPASAEFQWLRQVLAWNQHDSRTAVEYERTGAGRLVRRASEMRAAPLGDDRVVVTWRDATEEARTRQELRAAASRAGRAPPIALAALRNRNLSS
jgi:hypothetical protein